MKFYLHLRCVQDIPKYNRPGTWENTDNPFLIVWNLIVWNLIISKVQASMFVEVFKML